MATDNLTPERLRELLHYEPLTGVFTWRNEQRTGYNGNGLLHRAGDIAGFLLNRRWKIGIDRKPRLAHRLAWLYMTGEWPMGEIDHMDGDPLNNQFANLRDVTRRVNAQNLKGPISTNSSGFLGVSKRKSRPNTWVYAIRMPDGSRIYGQRKSPEDAHAAYLEAKRAFHEGNLL